MRFQLIGVNHKSAPLDVRERLAIPESRLPDTCRELTAYPGIEEGMVISTCNRVELVTHTTNGHADLRGFLHDHFHLASAELDPHLYEFREKDAVRHLFRVASSLDSMVVGEAQILGQVKEAYATARAVGAVRGQLDQLFSRAFAVAKRVRSETAIGSSSVSIASVAVELAKKIFGTLQGKKVLLVGAGKMSELAARHLMAHGCASIFVANRTYERAIGLAQKFDGQAIKFEDLYASATEADIVITSTGAPHAIFKREHGEQFLPTAQEPARCSTSTSPSRAMWSPEMIEAGRRVRVRHRRPAAGGVGHIAERRKEAEQAEAIMDERGGTLPGRLQTLTWCQRLSRCRTTREDAAGGDRSCARAAGTVESEQETGSRGADARDHQQGDAHANHTLKTAANESEATTIVDVVRSCSICREAQRRRSGSGQGEVGTGTDGKTSHRFPGSQLALWQANHISATSARAWARSGNRNHPDHRRQNHRCRARKGWYQRNVHQGD